MKQTAAENNQFLGTSHGDFRNDWYIAFSENRDSSGRLTGQALLPNLDDSVTQLRFTEDFLLVMFVRSIMAYDWCLAILNEIFDRRTLFYVTKLRKVRVDIEKCSISHHWLFFRTISMALCNFCWPSFGC
jgi:hypothetical protein